MTIFDASLSAQSDLRYLLTLRPGQSAALINLGAHLYDALQDDDGLNVQALSPDMLPSTNLDAIFLAAPFSISLESILQVCAKSLKPGGQVLLCLPNDNSIKRLKSLLNGKKRRLYTIPNACRAAKFAGLAVRAKYGIYDSVDEPRFLVPLENPQVTGYFFNTMLTPYTNSTRLLLGIAPLMVALRLHPSLFTDLCLVLDLPC
jgi:hypothetical protein